MKFNDLTDEQIEYIKKVYTEKSDLSWEKRAYKLGEELGVSERTIRKWVSKKLGLKQKLDIEPEQYVKAQKRKFY
jgi:hypothetical protein